MSVVPNSLNELDSMLDEMELLRFGDYDRALDLSQTAQGLAKKLNAAEELGRALNGAARVYTYKGELEQSTDFVMQSIKLAQLHNLPSLEGWALYLLSTNFQYVGDYHAARQLLERQRDLATRLHDDALYAIALSDLGYLYFCLHDYPKSIAVLHEALSVCTPQIWNGALLGIIHMNLALVYGKQQQQQLMVHHGQKAIDWSKGANSLLLLASAYIYLANGHLVSSNLEQAQICLDKAAEIIDPLDIPLLTVGYLTGRGNIWFQQGDIKKAFNAFETALNLTSQHNLFESQVQIYVSFIQINQQLGDCEAVYNYQVLQQQSREKASYHSFEKRLEILKTIFNITRPPSPKTQPLIESRKSLQPAHNEQELELPIGLRKKILSQLAHEFRTPLTIIRTSADLLSNYYDRMTEEQHLRHFERIQNRVVWMTVSLDRILLLLKLNQNERENSLQAIELERIIDQTKDEVGRFYGDINRVAWVWDVPNGLSRIPIDADLLREILIQLVSNALKFSSVLVNVNLQLRAGQLKITVIDSGIGIPKDELTHIKEIFYRASNINEAPGYGIGLAIVDQAILACNGKWHITSELSVGTQVEITLPLSFLGDDAL